MRVVTPDALNRYDQEKSRAIEQSLKAQNDDVVMTELARHINSEWEMMRNHRNSSAGWSERMLHAQRCFNGQYDASQLAAIRQFKGSEVYARVIALKARGATAMLREVYLGGDRPWGLDATPEPGLPEDMLATIAQLVDMEAQNVLRLGGQLDLNQLRDRMTGLIDGARRATKKKARAEAKLSEDMLDDLLIEGGYYEALMQVLTDLSYFPLACMKGPVVRILPDVVWRPGRRRHRDARQAVLEPGRALRPVFHAGRAEHRRRGGDREAKIDPDRPQ